MFVLVTQSCLILCNSMGCSLPGSSVHGDSPGKNTGVGCHARLKGIFPTQGWNPGLPHCKQILYYLNHQGSPCNLLCGFYLVSLYWVLLPQPEITFGWNQENSQWIIWPFGANQGIPAGSDNKESACNVGDLGSIPGLERSPGEEKGKALQYSCLENSMNRGA